MQIEERLLMKIISIGLLGIALTCACIPSVLAAHLARSKETILYSFEELPDAEVPNAGLVYAKTILYGTTNYGGAYGNAFGDGAVYSVDPKTGAETVLHSFGSGADGANPYSTLVATKRMLYGTTYYGGTYGTGTVFAVDAKTGAETVLHSFGSGTDGQYPRAGVIDVNGTLYGTTNFGGTSENGTLFALDIKSGVESVLYSFGNSPDGRAPSSVLTYVNGRLYGTTVAGGTNNSGTAFEFDPHAGTETIIHSFAGGADGSLPVAGLLDVNGVLYGTTLSGGTNDDGTIYALDPNTGTETVLHSFGNGTDGQSPDASLVAVKHTLYGTTLSGGANNAGSVFTFDLEANAETVIHSFGSGSDGANPSNELIDVKGALYGTTGLGGTNGLGTVFVLTK
jgi:uncharacterized repeat protein (TIGR03803 family)